MDHSPIYENPAMTDFELQRQFISCPGCTNCFSWLSHIPLATLYFLPFMATWAGRGLFPACECDHIASVIPNSVCRARFNADVAFWFWSRAINAARRRVTP